MTGKARTLILGAVLTALATVPPPAAADEAELEATYLRYHTAIVLAELCRGLTFDQADHLAMAGVIHQRIDNGLGGKRPSLLVKAKTDAKRLKTADTCKGPRVQTLLALFDAELAPVLP